MRDDILHRIRIQHAPRHADSMVQPLFLWDPASGQNHLRAVSAYSSKATATPRHSAPAAPATVDAVAVRFARCRSPSSRSGAVSGAT